MLAGSVSGALELWNSELWALGFGALELWSFGALGFGALELSKLRGFEVLKLQDFDNLKI